MLWRGQPEVLQGYLARKFCKEGGACWGWEETRTNLAKWRKSGSKYVGFTPLEHFGLRTGTNMVQYSSLGQIGAGTNTLLYSNVEQIGNTVSDCKRMYVRVFPSHFSPRRQLDGIRATIWTISSLAWIRIPHYAACSGKRCSTRAMYRKQHGRFLLSHRPGKKHFCLVV